MKSPSRTPLTALIVEENTQRNEYLRRTLSGHGYQVLTADSFLCAVSMLAARGRPEIDILVTQQRTTYMEGFELARWVHGLYPGLKCLVMSDGAPTAQPFPCSSLPTLFDERTLLSSVEGLFTSMAAAA